MLVVYDESTFGTLLDYVEMLKGVKAREDYHPEKDVMEHSIQTFNWAMKETDDMELIVAALVHDVGKSVEELGHEQIGAGLIHGLVSPKVHFLVENHTRIRYYYEGKTRQLKKVNYLAQHPFFTELVMLSRYDKLGRVANKTSPYSRELILDRLNKKALQRYEEGGIDDR
jgi:predicted HD phosphohydrolase